MYLNQAATEGIEALTLWMDTNAPEFSQVTGPKLIECFGGLLSEPDKIILTPAFAEEDAAIIRRALQVSYYGWFDDDMAFVADWGFDLSAIKVPVSLWQGDLDFMVPHSHGIWLQKNIPNSVLMFKEGEGHISLPENRRGDIIKEALSYMF
jgi:pimeloyl-ACP methyl ester carboxylesterase